MFKLTWGWGQSKTFPSAQDMSAWTERNEDELDGMFGVKRYVKGADGNWYPLGEDG